MTAARAGPEVSSFRLLATLMLERGCGFGGPSPWSHRICPGRHELGLEVRGTQPGSSLEASEYMHLAHMAFSPKHGQGRDAVLIVSTSGRDGREDSRM